jgi:hypothetical protein
MKLHSVKVFPKLKDIFVVKDTEIMKGREVALDPITKRAGLE